MSRLRLLAVAAILALSCKFSHADSAATNQEQMDRLKREICDHPLIFPRRVYITSKTIVHFEGYLQSFDEALSRALRKTKFRGRGFITLWVGVNSKGIPYSTEIVQSSGNEEFNNLVIRAIQENAPYDAFTPPMSQIADEIVFLRSVHTSGISVPSIQSDGPKVTEQDVDAERIRVDELDAKYRRMYEQICGHPVQ